MTMEQASGIAPERSTFVNGLAWIFIVLAGFSTLISILQNIMVHLIFPKVDMSQMMQQAEQTQHMPAFAAFMFNHIYLFFLLILLTSATTLISAIGLLKRKNWARILFILLMSLGILWNIGGLVFQFTFFASMPEMAGAGMPPEMHAKMQAEMQTFIPLIQVFSVIVVTIFTALFAYIIKRLCSSEIRAEFS